MGAQGANRGSLHSEFELDVAEIYSLEHPATQDGDHPLAGQRLGTDVVPDHLLARRIWRTGQHIDTPKHRAFAEATCQ